MAKRKSAYTTNRNRIMAYQRRLRKKGMEIDIYFPTEKELRKQGIKGTELTKYTRELKQFTSKELTKIAKPLKQELVDIPIKVYDGNFYKLIIESFKSELKGLPNKLAGKFIALINEMVSSQGEKDTAYALTQMPYTVFYYLQKTRYDSSVAVEEFSSALINYLPNASEQYKSDLMDAFEYEELGYDIEDV